MMMASQSFFVRFKSKETIDKTIPKPFWSEDGGQKGLDALCLKITEKVSFNIASEASYVYILSGQKVIKNAILASIWKPEACGQTVLPEKSVLIGQKLVESAKI